MLTRARHPPGAPFTFVTDGFAAAIERGREIAGDRDVGLAAGSILLDGPSLIEGTRVTHLRYRVRPAAAS